MNSIRFQGQYNVHYGRFSDAIVFNERLRERIESQNVPVITRPYGSPDDTYYNVLTAQDAQHYIDKLHELEQKHPISKHSKLKDLKPVLSEMEALFPIPKQVDYTFNADILVRYIPTILENGAKGFQILVEPLFNVVTGQKFSPVQVEAAKKRLDSEA